MQQETVSKHPGLSNPQISKIIGEKWANEAPEVKAQWKRKAAEEAERHKQRHPDYRYAPKRKGSTAEPSTPGRQAYYTDGERCAKCNGLRMLSLPKPAARDRYDSELSSAASFEGSKRQLAQFMEDDEREYGRRSSSPQAKRRRLPETAGSRGVVPIHVRDAQERKGIDMRMPASAGHDGRYVHVDTPLPSHYAMAPPPRPGLGSAHPGSAHPGPPHPGPAHPGYKYADRDASVRLPPLKTAITPGQSPSQGYGYGWTPLNTSHSSDKTAPNQIMSIRFDRKSAIVNKICPPLPRMADRSRGAIIAIEGADPSVLEQVSAAVESSLIVCRDAVVTAWSGPTTLDQMKLPSQGDEFKNLAHVVFKDILAWHAISSEMTNFVTRRCISQSPNADRGSQDSSPSANHPSSPNGDDSHKIPVALIKNGFSLTHSDKFACATTINLGHYKPMDHWQWMATLWRGIVGADLVVYIQTSPEEEMDKLKTVEYFKALNAMVVRVPVGKGLSEATERRLNFEIIEWVTDIWPKPSPKAE